MLERKRLYITGRVQGVGFRAHTKKEAMRLGVKGWVKNLSDGRVEAVVVGARTKVEKLIDSLKVGPALAKVEQIEVKTEEYQDEFNSFSIRY